MTREQVRVHVTFKTISTGEIESLIEDIMIPSRKMRFHKSDDDTSTRASKDYLDAANDIRQILHRFIEEHVQF